jgi:heavy metal translocating P-type ATPase
MNDKFKNSLSLFGIPLIVLLGIFISLFFQHILRLAVPARVILLLVIIIGSFELIADTLQSIINRRFALDYIALLAIAVGLLSGEYLVSAIITLMLAGGNTLEKYGKSSARSSLTALIDRIPNQIHLSYDGGPQQKVAIESVQVGQEILIRKGEVIPLDGVLVSPFGLTDESSLTGEPYEFEKITGDTIRSGTVNIGEVMRMRVTKADKDSTYRKIIDMVKQAQKEKAPLIRLADRYSGFFTLITITICGLAYFLTKDFSRVLAVLVIATPCPLILATPIALMGGMNAAARKRIILKRLSSLEVLSRVSAIIFDKTGTITLGKPALRQVVVKNSNYTQDSALAVAAAIERNSLHPVAKALVESARKLHIGDQQASKVTETVGAGISGTVNGKTYTISKVKNYEGMGVQLSCGGKQIALFELADELKGDSGDIIAQLKRLGLDLLIFTGDKAAAAAEVVKQLGTAVTIKAECSPEDKKLGIAELKNAGKITAMVGDGINDAPALAFADVGMVFASGEQTAASEAADVVFLGGDFSAVTAVFRISKRTIAIARQSILFGIGASVVGMIAAAFGYIPPVTGAFAQEAIDVFVILNALRASRS